MAEQKSRAYLKSLFQAGRIPTETDFALLIDSTLNINSDQIQRLPDAKNGDSIAISAGSANALVSFFTALSKTGADWVIKLSSDGKSLGFYAKNNDKPIFSLIASGQLTNSTDIPGPLMQLNGKISATGMQLSQNLEVKGNATFSALTLPGLGTITDLASLKKILSGTASGTTTPVNLIPDQTQKIAPPTPSEPKPQPPVSKPDYSDITHTAPQSGMLSASKHWQQIAGPFTGFTALNIIAWLDAGENRSICHANAVNIDGDAATEAISYANSYQGRPGSKIKFRWNGDKTGYWLECRVPLNAAVGAALHYKLTDLMS